ncbi:MAG: helix-turn-helix domain-containing protein [Clostridia bacterium]|nr:helix-turn-helix domain-containing protein [Clostridia bacterium]MBP3360223.1 helix-turn-helix domain-containing protein [Clostridia bacterium]
MLSTVILDDEIWAVRDIERLLGGISDFEIVLRSSDPQKVIEFLSVEGADVLFTDIKMPGMTGLQVAQEIKSMGIDTLVVIISGYDDYEYMHESILSGVFDYLLKPIMREDFERVLERIRHAFPADTGSENQQSEIFKKLLEYINDNYDKDIKLADVASQNYVSERYVAQLFNRYYDMSFLQYLTKLRMERARHLLLTTQKTISEIGNEVGYSNGSYFNKVFKKYYDQTPNSVRRNGAYE